jgi:hypothetical protein
MDDGTGQPDPRYRVWVGWDGSNFSQSTNSPGLYSGCSGVYGADDVRCNVWDPGDITLPTLTGNMSTYNVEMESWEEDEGIACCVNDNCNKNSSGVGGFPCFGICPNLDDTRCGRLRIGDISYVAMLLVQTILLTATLLQDHFYPCTIDVATIMVQVMVLNQLSA